TAQLFLMPPVLAVSPDNLTFLLLSSGGRIGASPGGILVPCVPRTLASGTPPDPFSGRAGKETSVPWPTSRFSMTRLPTTRGTLATLAVDDVFPEAGGRVAVEAPVPRAVVTLDGPGRGTPVFAVGTP